MRPWQPKRQWRLATPDGRPAASYHDEQILVRDHFGKLLKAHPSQFADMVARDRADALFHACEHATVTRQLDVLPSIDYLTRKYAGASPLKGVGELAYGCELHKLLPHTMAFITHPLHVKTALTVRAPVQWMGGQITHLWKKKGDMKAIKNHRDITLADCDGKDFGGHLRGCLLPAVERMTVPTQFGSGLNGGATDVGHLMVSQAVAYSLAAQVSLAILFVDVVSAFASMHRQRCAVRV
eukprot:3045717-Karenia_brevis.AAC.1